MVKLVGVYQGGAKSRTRECKSRRYLPLEIEPELTMIMALEEFCLACGSQTKSKQPEDVQALMRNYNSLDKDELTAALMVTWGDMLESLSQTVTCVGCRRSVENLFNNLKETSEDCSIDPLVLTKDGILSISRQHLLGDPAGLANLLCHQVNRLHRQYIDGPANKKSGSKKGGRCAFHTLEHKKVLSGSWLDCWDVMEPECKEEVVLLPFSAIRATLDKYLKKHSFCCECANMINKAFTYLIEEGRDPAKVIKEEDGEGDSEEEEDEEEDEEGEEGDDDEDYKKSKGGKKGKGCDSDDGSLSLFSGISSCVSDSHVHITCNPTLISQLLLLAEPELSGLDQERHAKNMETAQKEVLTCIGITLFNRFYKIQQKLREGEQTCDLLFLVALQSLRKSLEISVERKRGILDLDALCFHIEQSDRDKERRQARKREKKNKQQQKKKDLKKQAIMMSESTTNQGSNLICDDEKVPAQQHRCDDTKRAKQKSCNYQQQNNKTSDQKSNCSSTADVKNNQNSSKKKKGKERKKKREGGHDGDMEDCGDSDSGLSCVWSGETSPLYSRSEGRFEQGNWIKGGSPDLGLGEGEATKQSCTATNTKSGGGCADVGRQQDMVMPSLEELLEETEDSEDSEDNMFISQEEMKEFQSMFPQLTTQREQLRMNLREKFAALCVNSGGRKSFESN